MNRLSITLVVLRAFVAGFRRNRSHSYVIVYMEPRWTLAVFLYIGLHFYLADVRPLSVYLSVLFFHCSEAMFSSASGQI